MLIRCVTVLFAPTIAFLREVAKRREGSVEPERDRAAARRWTAIAGEGESGINGYRSLYSEHCPLFCGRGGEASDVFLCRTLTQSPTVPALSRREPWFDQFFHSVGNRVDSNLPLRLIRRQIASCVSYVFYHANISLLPQLCKHFVTLLTKRRFLRCFLTAHPY